MVYLAILYYLLVFYKPYSATSDFKLVLALYKIKIHFHCYYQLTLMTQDVLVPAAVSFFEKTLKVRSSSAKVLLERYCVVYLNCIY